ncbi:hypothetical protein F5Y11DRAFT_196506 [Daldinia sp. FL1419]|nr:hypothetical protein F5Y11DRAFT_196506 [Daldinia sp. FL1419]
MNLTFDLFARIGIPLIPYYLDGGDNCPCLLYSRFFKNGRVDKENGGCVLDDTVDNVPNFLNDAFGPYKKALEKNFETGFRKLMTVDDLSTREFPRRGGPDGKLRKYDFLLYLSRWRPKTCRPTCLIKDRQIRWRYLNRLAFVHFCVYPSYNLKDTDNKRWHHILGHRM